jgi:hypothetical protein
MRALKKHVVVVAARTMLMGEIINANTVIKLI